MSERQILEQFRSTPEGQRLLQAIRFAEGTSGPQGYRTQFGGGTFSDLSRHPDQVISSGGYRSAAAGAYQFLPGTWNRQASKLGLSSFGPYEQDIAALGLARDRLMPLGGLSVLKQEGLSPRVSAALAPEWASFPTLSGKSYYGQPAKTLKELQDVYGGQVLNAAAAGAPSAPASEGNFKTRISDLLFKYLGNQSQGSDPYSALISSNAIADSLEEEGTIEALAKADEIRSAGLAKAFLSPSPSNDYSKLAQDLLSVVQERELGRTIATTGSPGSLSVVQYITGDPQHPNFMSDHSGSNYHDHLEFPTVEQARAAAARLNQAGIKTTELKGINPVGKHTAGSAHYRGVAFDVPGAQVPVGQERQLSSRVRNVLGFG